jgi:hypothetical protein
VVAEAPVSVGDGWGAHEELEPNVTPGVPYPADEDTDKVLRWAQTTLAVGTPVKFTSSKWNVERELIDDPDPYHGYDAEEEAYREHEAQAYGYRPVYMYRGARGVVASVPFISDSANVVLVPVRWTDVRDPAGLPIDELKGHVVSFEPYQLEPLVDNWARHQQPYVGRKMRPNPSDAYGALGGDGTWAPQPCVECGEMCIRDSSGAYVHEDPALEQDHVCVPEHRGIEPNKKARAIGRRPSMNTRFGEEIEDPDDLPAAEGRQLDKAMDRYETFHAKKPIRLIELEHELPTGWEHKGDALAVMYRTDKWKSDGTDEDYKHLHDAGDDKPYEINRGVRIYEPKRGGQRLPVARPKALALLGYCLGAFVRQRDGEIYETNPRGCYLFSSPSGNLLLLYSPDKQPDGSSGFLAAMAGGNLRVLKDGIDG